MAEPVYTFGYCTFGDQLTVLGEYSHLSPSAYNVLRTLLDARGVLVTSDELVQQHGVSLSGLRNVAAEIRRAIGQGIGASRPLECIHGRGYRFHGAVRSSGPSDRQHRALWHAFAIAAAQGGRDAAECVKLADALVAAEMERFE